MAFTEFYAQSGGSNLNAGSTTNNTAAYTSTNGSWSTVTNIFTPTDASTPSDFVSVGDFVSIYLDAATVAVFIARVTNVAPGLNGGITVSTTAKMGAAPATGSTGRSIKAGGAWLGPNGSSTFPLSNSFNLGAPVNVNGDIVRLNLKNDQTYSISVQIGVGGGTAYLQGYSSSPGDGGRATISTGTNTNNAISGIGANVWYIDLILTSTASSATGHGFVQGTATNARCLRITVTGFRGNGFQLNTTSGKLIECEVYNCNKSNTAGQAGIIMGTQSSAYRCISAGNSGSNTDGFNTGAGVTDVRIYQCVSHGNGRNGFSCEPSASAIFEITNCDSYNNGGDGFHNLLTTTVSNLFMENCNFIKNSGYGINSDIITGEWNGVVNNCGFGSGTMVNGLGDTNNLGNLSISGTVTYEADANPYQDPATGNFSLVPTNTLRHLGTGRGTFTETQGGFSGTQGYPDIGAAQHNADLLDEGVAGIGGA